jgi:choline dehydrogenase-like flavoprotein
MDDLPYADNAVWPLPPASGPLARRSAIRYRIRPEGRARIRRFRSLMREVLEPYPYLLIKQAENNRMLAHVCGTCRFGNDPDKSVIDAHNRAHGLANLYVTDSSFFPSSGGTNPSLTIAANALRIAALLTGVGDEAR